MEINNHEVTPEAIKNSETSHEVAPATVKEEIRKKKKLSMVPIFSWRTLIVIAIGLAVGTGLGLLYFTISPSIGFSSNTPADTQSISSSSFKGPWQCKVNIQVVNPGSSYVDLDLMQNLGEYYTAKANSSPFFEFASEKLPEYLPQYSYTVNNLDDMIDVTYDTYAETPAMVVQVTGPTLDETMFLINTLPEVFKDYLITEENLKLQREYENALVEQEQLKEAIIEAQQELSLAIPLKVTSDLQNNPRYIALSTRKDSLEKQIYDQADTLSTFVALGNPEESGNSNQQEYQKTLQEIGSVKTTLLQAQNELSILAEKKATNQINNAPGYVQLNAKIKALESELNKLMIGYTTGTEKTVGLAELISGGTAKTSSTYIALVEKIDTTSMALSEARGEMAILESQSSEEQLELELDYKVAEANVKAIDIQLTALMNSLTQLTPVINDENTQEVTEKAFERTSVALAEVRKELTTMESQPSDERLKADIEYQVAQARVNNLNKELSLLNSKASSLLAAGSDVSDVTEQLAVGVPDIPMPIRPIRLRDALLFGGILGIGIGWIVLNRKWLAKAVSSSQREDEEN